MNQNQPLAGMLKAVMAGEYGAFQEWLIGNHILILDFSQRRLRSRLFNHLGLALHGTPVETLILEGNGINDAVVGRFFMHLAGTQVRVVNLDDTKVTNVGVKELATHLINTKVTEISLWNTDVTDEGALALVTDQEQNGLITINFGDCEISEEAFLAMIPAIENNRIRELLADDLPPALQEALNNKRQRIESIALAIASLPYHEPKPALKNNLFPTPEEELSYAVGICMHVDSLVVGKVLRFLPNMLLATIEHRQQQVEDRQQQVAKHLARKRRRGLSSLP